MSEEKKASDNYFVDLAKIDVSDFVEKKGKFSYLSWTWAIDQLRRYDPTATWETVRHDGMPYLKTDCGYFVEVAVTVKGVTLSEVHPVLDNNNRPIAQPNAFQINNSQKRALVKAIALHGLGLYIYAGEDVPESGQDDAGADNRPKTPRTQENATVGSGKPQKPAKIEDVPKALVMQYKLGTGGKTDGLLPWIDKLWDKGMTYPQMEWVLKEQLDKKKVETTEKMIQNTEQKMSAGF